MKAEIALPVRADGAYVTDGDGFVIATCDIGQWWPKGAQQNAEAIADALNDHAALVEMLGASYVIKTHHGVIEQHVNRKWTYVGNGVESPPYFKTALEAFAALQQQEDK